MTELSSSDRKGIPIGAVEIGMIGAIARWCECINGHGKLEKALALIAKSLGAEAAALTRAARNTAGGCKSVFYDAPNTRSGMFPLQRSFARAVLREYFDQSKVGAIWFKSMIDQDGDPALSKFHSQRMFAELAVIPLTTGEKSFDFLELHFPSQLCGNQHAILNIVASTLSTTWKNRTPGLITGQLVSSRNAAVQDSLASPILSFENPARLSRAEYRVCLMLSKCLTNKQIRFELGICNSTLRAHLRHIYPKAKVTSQAELTHHLLTMRPVGLSHVSSRSA